VKELCPVCNKEMKYYSGNELEPYEYHCEFCDFSYQEHIDHSMSECAEIYKKYLIAHNYGDLILKIK